MDFDEMLKAGKRLAKKMEEERSDQVLITFQVPRKFRTELMAKVKANHIDFSEYLRQCCKTLLEYPVDTATKQLKKTNKEKLEDLVEQSNDKKRS